MRVMSPTDVDPKAGLALQQQKLKKACQDFESIMTTYLLKGMNDTVQRAESEAFGSGRDLYEGMMVEAVANQLSHSQGLGLAKLLYEQLAPGLETVKTVANPISMSLSREQEDSAPPRTTAGPQDTLRTAQQK